jgi:hypothetical protein
VFKCGEIEHIIVVSIGIPESIVVCILQKRGKGKKIILVSGYGLRVAGYRFRGKSKGQGAMLKVTS